MNPSIDATLRERPASAPEGRLRTAQVFMLAALGLFLGTAGKSTLDTVPATGNRLLAMILAGLLTLGEALLMLDAMEICDHKDLPELLPMLFPRWISGGILAIMALLHAIYAGLLARSQAEGIGAFLLESTPQDVMTLALLATAAFLLQRDVRQLARVSELLFWSILSPVITVFALALGQMDMGELRTLTELDGTTLLPETLNCLQLFSGVDFLLFFYGRSEGSPASRRAALGGVGLSLGMAVLFLLVAVGVFSLAGWSRIDHPMSEVVRVLNTSPNRVLERMDVFFAVSRVMLVTLNLTLALYAGCRSTAALLGLGSIRVLLPPTVIAAFLVASLSREVGLLSFLHRMGGILQGIVWLGIVPAVAITARVRKARGMRQ